MNVVTDANIEGSMSAESITSASITSNNDLNIAAAINKSVIATNIKYKINDDDQGLIDANAIKSFKIFITTKDTRIEADESSDGFEIIIFNNNPTTSVIIRDLTRIIETPWHKQRLRWYICSV